MHSRWRPGSDIISFTLVFLLSLSLGARCKKPRTQGEDTLAESIEFLTQGPHPMGSDRQALVGDWLLEELRSMGLKTGQDSFQAEVPDPAWLDRKPETLLQKVSELRTGRNIYAWLPGQNASCLWMLGSHYDTKRMDTELGFVGANDSASSSAALLEILRQLRSQPPLPCSILAVWFDGEEAWLSGWNDGEERHPLKKPDHLYGSRHLAASLDTCEGGLCLPAALGSTKIEGLILLDMIGSPRIRLSADTQSDPSLLRRAQALDHSLFAGKLYQGSYPKSIIDDHSPFRARGLPALDLIDFENLDTWHSPSDNFASLDLDSIRQINTLTIALLKELMTK